MDFAGFIYFARFGREARAGPWLAGLETLRRERRLDQFDPVAHAVGEGGVVEIIGRVMEHRAVAVAEEDERARARFEHERKVLRAHDRSDVRIHMGIADDLARDLGGELGLRRMIDGRRVAATIFDPRRRAGRRGDTCGDLMDALFNPVARRGLERADRAVEADRLRNDVARRAGLKAGDRYDASVERIDVARGDGLQGEHDLRACDHRIDALMRHRRVAACPSIVIVISSAAAMSGPLRNMKDPTGIAGQLCMP